jgi:hypothetical protein
MAAHNVDGFGLQFTSRTSWKAEITKGNKSIAIAPVTWTKGYVRDPQGSGLLLEVWYRRIDDMEAALSSRTPFLVALASAKDYSKLPHDFDFFTGVFEVVSTGIKLTENSIQTKVLRRIKARDLDV